MMKQWLAIGFTVGVMLVGSVGVIPEERVFEIWRCKINEGKALADVAAANQRWVVFQNRVNPDAGIASWLVTPIVGRTGGFMYLDSFPNLEAWTAARAAEKTPDGAAVVSALDLAASCSSSSLHEAVD
jgi:hypothetical protein